MTVISVTFLRKYLTDGGDVDLVMEYLMTGGTLVFEAVIIVFFNFFS